MGSEGIMELFAQVGPTPPYYPVKNPEEFKDKNNAKNAEKITVTFEEHELQEIIKNGSLTLDLTKFRLIEWHWNSITGDNYLCYDWPYVVRKREVKE